MDFIPHTPEQIEEMLEVIGVKLIDDLFDEIPAHLQNADMSGIPEGISEMEMLRRMTALAKQDEMGSCFIGAGCYDHYIPSAVWDIATRGEFYTSYTPYQAEASQGNLQLMYEFQTMMASLTGMEVSNASVYDGASALAESILMAVRVHKKAKSRKVLYAGTLNPLYRDTAQTSVTSQGIELVEIPIEEGVSGVDLIPETDCVAVVIQQPNFFGQLESVDELTDKAHEMGALVIASVNPLSLAVLKPPGEWGESGADIVCGDGQSLGIPMCSGGPSYGFMCTRMANVRQLPGRICGKTVDEDGNPGFALTLQAREQHIRRGKATSNICTNQGLLVTGSTIHMAILGHSGLVDVATNSMTNTRKLVECACELDFVRQKFTGPFFHEAVLQIDRPIDQVCEHMREKGVLAGLPLGDYFPDLSDCLLVCATEKRCEEEIEQYRELLGNA